MTMWSNSEKILNPHRASKKQHTNADRVRAMTDEELAHEFAMIAGWDRTEYAKAQSIGIEKVMLDWLQKPVKE